MSDKPKSTQEFHPEIRAIQDRYKEEIEAIVQAAKQRLGIMQSEYEAMLKNVTTVKDEANLLKDLSRRGEDIGRNLQRDIRDKYIDMNNEIQDFWVSFAYRLSSEQSPRGNDSTMQVIDDE